MIFPRTLSLSTRIVINNAENLEVLRKRRLAVRWMWFNAKPMVSGEHHRPVWQRVNSEIFKREWMV